jgi:hypothetical protein
MLTLNYTDSYGVTTPRVHVVTNFEINFDIHGNVTAATIVTTDFENAAAHTAGQSLGNTPIDVTGYIKGLVTANTAVSLTTTSAEDLIISSGYPFVGATQSTTT